MNILSGNTSFFGLDIGTTAVRLVELHNNGSTKVLSKYGYVPIDSKLSLSDAKADRQKLAETIKQLVDKAQLSTKNVAVGLPAQRVFTTVIDIDRMPKNELSKAIRYQAESAIPTPLSESKIDWAEVGDSPQDKAKIEVLLSSVSNDFIEQELDMLEGIGLNVIAFEPNSLALCRALIAPGLQAPLMLLYISSKATDLVVYMNDAPHLVRSIPVGREAIVRAAAQNLNVDEKQAEQFVFKFGMSKEKLEGQIYQAIIGTIDLLMSEIDKSIKFFKTRYGDVAIERTIVTGGASALPELPVYIANKFGLNVEIGNAWRNVSFDPSRQNELLGVANHFGTAVGLAERI